MCDKYYTYSRRFPRHRAHPHCGSPPITTSTCQCYRVSNKYSEQDDQVVLYGMRSTQHDIISRSYCSYVVYTTWHALCYAMLRDTWCYTGTHLMSVRFLTGSDSPALTVVRLSNACQSTNYGHTCTPVRGACPAFPEFGSLTLPQETRSTPRTDTPWRRAAGSYWVSAGSHF